MRFPWFQPGIRRVGGPSDVPVRSQLRVTKPLLPAVCRSGCCEWGRAFPEDGNAKDGSAKCQVGTEAPRTCRAQNGQRQGRKRRGLQRDGECMVSAERRSAKRYNEHPAAQRSTASADRMASSGMTNARWERHKSAERERNTKRQAERRAEWNGTLNTERTGETNCKVI